MSARLHFEWTKHGRVIETTTEPTARELREIGGCLEYLHYRVRFDERASLMPWVTEWRGAVGSTNAVAEAWFSANAFATFREARASARRLTRESIARLAS